MKNSLRNFYQKVTAADKRAKRACAGLLAAALAVAALTALPPRPEAQATASPMPMEMQTSAAPEPRELRASDIDRYRAIFALQASENWQEANKMAAQLADKRLMGHVLAERYLSKSYTSTYNELHQWLSHYGDHPQAEGIFRLAAARRAEGDPALPEIAPAPALKGFGDDNGLSNMERPEAWLAGLDAWKRGDYAASAEQFKRLADTGDIIEPKLSPWKIAGAAFWAHRGFTKLGDSASAAKYLAQAAEYPRTFYGILARKQLGRSLDIEHGELPALARTGDADLLTTPAVQRAVALTQAGQEPLAERELRRLFPKADRDTRVRLLALAKKLNLPAAQITMARMVSRNGLTVDSALYPVPRWTPPEGFDLDPALVFAFARQESGFNPNATGVGGSMGLMQLMPETARLMQKKSAAAGLLHGYDPMEPEANLALGQTYLKHLLENPLVKGNLIYLAAAYNAGPGRIAEWKKSIEAENDPLLFMESIPFGITRNYVAQVLTSYWMYQAIDGRRSRSAFSLARGQWPTYDADAITTAANDASRG